MAKVVLTKEGLAKLREELKYLKQVKRKEIAAQISEAKGYGDISENAEYDNAKEEQAFLEGRISDIERMIRNSEIIERTNDCTKVSLGCKVVIQSDHTKNEYILVGTNEVDPTMGKISAESPIGSALIGKAVGDLVVVNTPRGRQVFRVINIA